MVMLRMTTSALTFSALTRGRAPPLDIPGSFEDVSKEYEGYVNSDLIDGQPYVTSFYHESVNYVVTPNVSTEVAGIPQTTILIRVSIGRAFGVHALDSIPALALP